MRSDLGSKPSLMRPRLTLLIGLLLPSASWLPLRPSSYLNVVERQPVGRLESLGGVLTAEPGAVSWGPVGSMSSSGVTTTRSGTGSGRGHGVAGSRWVASGPGDLIRGCVSAPKRSHRPLRARPRQPSLASGRLSALPTEASAAACGGASFDSARQARIECGPACPDQGPLND